MNRRMESKRAIDCMVELIRFNIEENVGFIRSRILTDKLEEFRVLLEQNWDGRCDTPALFFSGERDEGDDRPA